MDLLDDISWDSSKDPSPTKGPLVDGFGRHITYVRLSVTDRCDFRCTYCMSEDMTFLPKKDILCLEELERLCTVFIERGVTKLRLTGGEPLVRRGIMNLFHGLAPHLETGALKELTLTTNGSQLRRFAADLKACGVKRINVSLDTLDEKKFSDITRWGRLPQVLDGIEAALEAGLKIKINTVALKGFNDQEIPSLIEWAHGKGMDLTLIEAMPMGDITGDLTQQYLPLSEVKHALSEKWTLQESDLNTGGPSRYVDVVETGGKLGLITPHTNNFCASCNRVRVTATGTLFMCLGQEDAIDLRAPLRASEGNELLHQAIDRAIDNKPKSHDFMMDENSKPAVSRNMSVTGG